MVPVCAMTIIYKFTHTLDPDNSFDEFLPLYELSGAPGLQELPRTQDSHSPPIFVPGGLVFGDEEVAQVYVSH